MKQAFRLFCILLPLAASTLGCAHEAAPTQPPVAVDTAFTYTCNYQPPITFTVYHWSPGSADLHISFILTARQHHYHRVIAGSDSGRVVLHLGTRTLDGGKAPLGKTAVDSVDASLATEWLWMTEHGACQLGDSTAHVDSVTATYCYRLSGDSLPCTIVRRYIDPPCTLHH